MKEEFIVDKDRADLEAMRDTATAILEGFEARLERFNWLVIEDQMSKEQRLEASEDIKIRRQEAEEQLEKANTALRRPHDIKHAVKRATQLVAEQMKVMWFLEDMKEDDQREYQLAESALAHASKTGDPWEEEIRAHFKQLDDLKKYNESLEESLEIVEELRKTGKAPNADELSTKEIGQFIYQQKRVILQQYIDPERRIQVWSKDKFEIHLSIPKAISDEEGSKQIKSFY